MLKSNKQQVLAKLAYLETQLENLDQHLPETYEFLISQIDCQKRVLVELEVNETFELIDTIRRYMTHYCVVIALTYIMLP